MVNGMFLILLQVANWVNDAFKIYFYFRRLLEKSLSSLDTWNLNISPRY